jgi:hypothetical protein
VAATLTADVVLTGEGNPSKNLIRSSLFSQGIT